MVQQLTRKDGWVDVEDCQPKHLAQLVVITLTEGAWFPLSQKTHPLCAPKRMGWCRWSSHRNMELSRENSCVRCDHMGNLLSLVAELEEEGERLRSAGDSEKEMSGRTALYHSLDKHICHPHHKKQWILYPLITRQKEWTSEMRGIEMRFCLGWQAVIGPLKGLV